MSTVYLVLMVAVGAMVLFVIADAMLSVSRRPAWQTPQARLAEEGATLNYVPPAPVAARAVAAPAEVPAKEEAIAA